MKTIQRIKLSIIAPAAVLAATGGAGVLGQEMPVSPEPAPSIPAASVASGESEAVREIKMLPAHKRSLTLKEEERNPYARRTPDLQIDENESGEETEFDRIRRVLMGLQVSGRTYGRRGIRLLAGNIIFEAGKEVPPVVEDQTEKLVVENVTENSLVIGWIDPDTNQATGKRLVLDYDLSAKVRYVLAGQVIDGGSDTKDLKFGVMTRANLPGAEAEESEAARRTGATASRLPEGISQEIFNQAQ